jgi:hypothetical protein
MAEVSAKNDVVIVTHEDFFGNFMEQYLAVFFMELQVRLEIVSLLQDIQSYGWTSGSPEKLILSREPYTKMIVNNTEMLKSVAADLMIVLGHGLKRINNQPSAVCFAPCDTKFVSSSGCLWGSRYRVEKNQDGSRDKLPDTITTLADVTARSKLAIVLTCRGDQILQDFLSDGPTNFTDMLLCDKEYLDNQSFCIFFVLLVNLIDSFLKFRPLRLNNVTMDEIVKWKIERIFQIVMQFGTSPEDFWDFLEKSGCVSSLEAVKASQGLPNIRENADRYYRVLGIPWNFPLRFESEDGTEEDKKQTILDDFKALKLVRWDVETKKVVCENWESSFDTPLDVYEQLIVVDTDTASSGKRQRRDDLGMLLERLRLSAGIELRRL